MKTHLMVCGKTPMTWRGWPDVQIVQPRKAAVSPKWIRQNLLVCCGQKQGSKKAHGYGCKSAGASTNNSSPDIIIRLCSVLSWPLSLSLHSVQKSSIPSSLLLGLFWCAVLKQEYKQYSLNNKSVPPPLKPTGDRRTSQCHVSKLN